MNKISKISSYIMFALLAISAILTGLIFFGGSTQGDPLEAPIYTDTILNWGKILIIGSIFVAVAFETYNIIVRPTAAKKTIISTGIILAVLVISYLLSDGTPMTILGYEGSDNVPTMLKVVDTGLFAFYLLMACAILAIVVSEISRMIRS